MISKRLLSLSVIAAVAILSARAEEKQRVSPHETVTANVNGVEIKIVYGRPYTKDPKTGAPRKIWGGLVPYGKVWRCGADEATLLTTNKTLTIGGFKLEPGTYSLFMMPVENGPSKLIINKQTGQWGTKYDSKSDLVSVELKKTDLDQPVDQFTIAFDNDALTFSWEKSKFSVPISAQS